MLRYAADRRTLVVISLYFFVLLAAMIAPLDRVLTPILVVALGLLSFLCAVITHNTVHVPMFHVRASNRVMQVILSLTYGHPVSLFVPGHNLSHHRHTQTDRDLMRTNKVRYRRNWLNQLLFAWKVGPTIFASNLRFAREMRRRRPIWFRQLIVETVAWIVMVGVSLVFDPAKAVLFVLLPHQYAAWGIMGINFVQHDGCDPESPWNHSRNFVGKWVNYLTFNNGFHGIHHMHPSLHWSLLPEAHAQELAPHIHPELDQPNFIAYLWRAFVSPGRRTRYDGTPFDPSPAGPDVDWVPSTGTLARDDLGAVH